MLCFELSVWYSGKFVIIGVYHGFVSVFAFVGVSSLLFHQKVGGVGCSSKRCVHVQAWLLWGLLFSVLEKLRQIATIYISFVSSSGGLIQ